MSLIPSDIRLRTSDYYLIKTIPMKTVKTKDTTKPKTSGDAKGKASMDQNGQGNAPKYGQASETPNESGQTHKNADTAIEKRTSNK